MAPALCQYRFVLISALPGLGFSGSTDRPLLIRTDEFAFVFDRKVPLAPHPYRKCTKDGRVPTASGANRTPTAGRCQTMDPGALSACDPVNSRIQREK